MMTRLRQASVVGVLSIFAASTAALGQAGPATEVMRLGLRGVYFVQNQGQWSDASVEYGFKTRGLDIAFREASFTMHLSRERSEPSEPDCASPTNLSSARIATGETPHSLDRVRSGSLDAAEYEHLTLAVTFPGSNPATPRGAQPQAAKFNYYIGDDESKWASDVQSFAAIIYENLYDGVDLLICGNDDGVLKYEFHVAPGADYSQIRIAYDGIDSLCVEESGDLRIRTSFGTLTDSAPLVWQEDVEARLDGGTAVPAVQRILEEPTTDDGRDARATGPTIPARFELVDATTYRFALDGAVDPGRTLIIDPDVEWMVYLGGSDTDWGHHSTSDRDGNVLLTGTTYSDDLEGSGNVFYGGERDAFVAKLSALGEVAWITYFGGSGSERGWRIALDDVGTVFITGVTTSSDLAGHRNSQHMGFEDAYVASLSPDGTLRGSVYLGGSRNDQGLGIVVESDGGLLVSGRTASPDFVGRGNAYHGGEYDAFVAGLSDTGQIEWMTYLGGSSLDFGTAIATDPGGNAFVIGETESLDFVGCTNSHHGDALDVFVCKLESDGTHRWMTYLGGSYLEWSGDLAVDSLGEVYVVGETESRDFEGRRNSYLGGFADGFMLKVDASGQLLWMDYVGGSGLDGISGVVLSSWDSVLLTAVTSSTNWPGRVNTYRGGTFDAACAEIDSSGRVVWMMYLGGEAEDKGSSLSLGADFRLLVSGITSSQNFEGHVNSYRGGETDAFVLRLHLPVRPTLAVSATCPDGGRIRVTWERASPDGSVAIIFAPASGSFTIPNGRPCVGTVLGLAQQGIRIVFRGASGHNGSRTLETNAGPGACGGFLQLLDLTTCATSDVARIE